MFTSWSCKNGQRNVQKSMVHVQSCCFANKTYCFFFTFSLPSALLDLKVPIMCLLFKVKLRPFQFSLGIYKIMQRPDKPFLQGMYLKIFLTLMAWTLMTRWNFWSPLKILLMRSGNRKITSLILRHAWSIFWMSWLVLLADTSNGSLQH